jgi:GTP-binding protein
MPKTRLRPRQKVKLLNDQLHNIKIFSGPISFLKSAPQLEFLPEPTVAEIAFAGRSNVGKSTLINALVNRNNLARTSNTPGRTQELNFFDVGEPALFRIVDMPGYGYAKAPLATVKKWRHLINDYLRGRVVLKRVFVLIDSRHGIKEVDHEIMAMLDAAAISYRIVLTKTDKIKATELEKVQAETQAALAKRAAAFPELSVTSAEKRGGIDELREAVLEAVRS